MYKRLIALGIFSLWSATIFALPEFASTSGSMTISQTKDTCVVTLKNYETWVKWNTFNIAQNETVNFKMNPDGLVINQVVGLNQPSHIDGKLIANGTVVLMNHSGIVFGKNANLDVGSLLATSASLTKPFSLDVLKYAPGAGPIIHEGTIRAAIDGLVVFLGPNVINNGKITGKYLDILVLRGDQGLEYWNAMGNNPALFEKLDKEGTITKLENGNELFVLGTETALYPVSVNVRNVSHKTVQDMGTHLRLQ